MEKVEYRQTQIGVQRVSDGMFIPVDESNKDWAAYLKWVKDGGETLPQFTVEEIGENERYWRDGELERIKWLRERHQDEIEQKLNTTLTAAQYSELLTYIQQLRDWPQSEHFPSKDDRPAKPEWFALKSQ